MNVETISVIGLGYIGLPTAAAFASRGKTVIGVDVSQHVVDTVNRGQIHIVEPELDSIVGDCVRNGFLKASTSPRAADAFLVAVPTPFKSEGNTPNVPDLKYIEAASKAISEVLQKGNLVILESTSPVGTTEKMAHWLAEARPDLTFPQTHGEKSDIRIAHCPERVLPGHVMRELVDNDRIIGGMTHACSQKAVELYQLFVEGTCFITDSRTAEMAKLTENSFRDVNIAFANELSVICDKLGINVWELIRLANHHPRVDILQPGPGVGGHCIAVDPWFIVHKTPEDAKLIASARSVNEDKPQWVVRKVQRSVAEIVEATPFKRAEEISITCFGLTFKPDIDDVRESPSLKIAQELSSLYPGQVTAVEPHLSSADSTSKLPEPIKLIDVIQGIRSDVIVMLVDHSIFKAISLSLAAEQRLIDTRGIWT